MRRVAVVSGAGDKGTSALEIWCGKDENEQELGIGPDGAQRLADLLLEAPPELLTSLDLRQCPAARCL